MAERQQLIDVGQPQIDTASAALIKMAFIDVELTGGVLAAEALKAVRDWSK